MANTIVKVIRTGLTKSAVLLALAAGSFAQPANTPYTIGPNVQISISQPAIPHYETSVAADLEHAGHLIACAYVARPGNQSDNVFYVSFDHGATWSLTLTVPTAVDPSCGLASGNAAFAAGIHDLPDEKATPVLTVHRSSDGGRTWKPAAITAEAPPIDRAWLTPDDSASRVYIHAYRYSKSPPAALVFFPSAADGTLFDTIRTLPAVHFEKPWFFLGNGVVDTDGSFYALAAELDDTKRNMSYRTDEASAPPAPNALLYVIASHDRGKTLQPAGRIEGVYYDWRIPQLSLPSLAIDRSRGPSRGRLYAVWPDARYDHRTRILFSSSPDHGRTWAPPTAIDENPTRGVNNFMPAVAVNNRGIVGVSWYDRRDAPDNIGYSVRFAASLDGGKTWLPSVKVSTAAHTDRGDTRKNSGDTAGLAAAADGTFHPVWIDNRTSVPQMWTTTITVRNVGRASRPARPSAAR